MKIKWKTPPMAFLEDLTVAVTNESGSSCTHLPQTATWR